MTMQWFRFYHEFATDPKVQMMSEVMQRRLVMLFCIRCCNDCETFHDDEVVFQLRISDDEWQQTKSIFIAKGFIDKEGNLRNWDKRQFVSDSSTARVRKHRERTKQQCNVSVTPPDTDTEQIQNKNKHICTPKQKKKKFTPPTEKDVVSYFVENGYTAESGRKAFRYYEEGDPPWHDSRGKPVRAWKQKMRGVWFKPENAIGGGNGKNQYKSRVDRNDAAFEQARAELGLTQWGSDEDEPDNGCIDVAGETPETRFIE